MGQRTFETRSLYLILAEKLFTLPAANEMLPLSALFAGKYRECMVRRVVAMEKLRKKKSLRKCIRPLWRSVLLALMSCARVRPSKSVGCSFETILVTRLETRRCDCSFVLAVPVQTSVGKFQAVAVVR